MKKSKILFKKSQKGQVILILLLVMTVALAIGLSIVQRSISDVSTSNRVEQSSRAFSAAEAGIERALQQDNLSATQPQFTLENGAVTKIVDSGLLPNPKQAIEYPAISKEEVIHMWLADPDANFETESGQYYAQPNLDIYWGSSDIAKPEDYPALELTVVSLINSAGRRTYVNKKIYLDPDSSNRRGNGFHKPGYTGPNISAFACSPSLDAISTIFSETNNPAPDRRFFCHATVTDLQPYLILLRARILYSNSSHPIAIKPVVPELPDTSCESPDYIPCSFPRQVKIIQSYGSFGDTQRAIQLFKIDKVVPFYFDYAIFSAGDIEK